MKTILNSLMLFALAALLGSCQDPVQVKLDHGSKLYIIDAFVNDLRTLQTVRVINNGDYFDDHEAPPVTGAVVTLKDLTANKNYAFNYTGNGNYSFNPTDMDTIAKINHQYELDVLIDGFTYTALTVQKRAAKIDSISPKFRDGRGGFGPGKPFYTCTLWALDKVDNNTDYYWVKTFRNDTLFIGPNDINVCIDGTGAPVTAAGKDSLNFTPPATFLGFHTYQENDVCKVEIHSIASDTYNFLLQAANQVNNGGLFATTPENVKTNIVTPVGAKIKAVGWFNMATVTSKTKVIKP